MGEKREGVSQQSSMPRSDRKQHHSYNNEGLYAHIFVINTVLQNSKRDKKGIEYSEQLQPIGRHYKLGFVWRRL